MLIGEVGELLAGSAFGPVRWVDGTGSTNADLLAAARTGAPAGTVLVADHQTAGRGRRGRAWVAPPGSALLASVLLRPRWSPEVTALLTPATALAVRDACASSGAEVALKWPNDVIAPTTATGPSAPSGTTTPPVMATPAGESKLAGVLAEFDSPAPGAVQPAAVVPGGAKPAAAPAVVVGFGVNLRAQADLTAAVVASERLQPTAAAGVRALPPVALEELVGHPVDRNELLVAVLLRLDAWYRRLAEPQGAADLVAELRHSVATLGREVQVSTPAGVVSGRATDITAAGHLVVERIGATVTLAAGDCHHVRPTTP